MKRAEIKDHIIKTASGLFYRNGYNSTGINEIIKESGIAKATLYNHFKSKDDLCLAYIRYMNEDFLNKISKFCHSKKEGKSRILAIFDFLEEFFNEEEFNGCWCIKTVSEIPKEDEVIRKEIQSQKSQFIEFISDLTKENLIGSAPKHNVSKARQIYLLYEGAVGESYLHQMNWPIVEAKNLCAQVL